MVQDISWVLTCAALVFFMQAGFLCLESGLTRSRNSINVAMKNIADISLAIMLYWAVGFTVMYGDSLNGWIGYANSLVDHSSENISFFIFQAMFCGTAVTILSGAIAERVKFSVYLIITLVVASFIYPVVGHWVWNQAGWLAQTGFIDFAGSTVVHSVGGWSALALLLIIGARKNRFGKDGKPAHVYHSNLPKAMLGVLILWFGWLGFNGGSALGINDTVPLIILNTILAGCAGLITSLYVERVLLKHYSARSSLNGVLAGLVAITASCHLVDPLGAIAIGATSAVVAFALEMLLLHYRIDDAVSAIPVHLGGGVWGTLAVPVFSHADAMQAPLVDFFLIQLNGVLIIGLFSFVMTYCIFRLINFFYPLRIDDYSEEIGLNISEHSQGNEAYELIKVMEQQSISNDLSTRAAVNEFSDTGLIARYYNKSLESLEQASRELELNKLKYEAISKNSPVGIISVNPAGSCVFANAVVADILELDIELLIGSNLLIYSGKDASLLALQSWIRKVLEAPEVSGEYEFRCRKGHLKSVYLQVGLETDIDGSPKGFILTLNDVTERVQLEQQLKHAQKMESIGQMAAGIAHEINSPLQFISSNIGFIQDSFASLITMQKVYTDMLCNLGDSQQTSEEDDELEYLTEEIPVAIEQTIDGVNRVSSIIQSMKQMVHPSSSELSSCNLNRTIENIMVITRNEWKIVADMKLDLNQALPEVTCCESEISQVLIILIVNACHAIVDACPEEKGLIKVTSRFNDSAVMISVLDNGPGIADDVIDKIFDPFFTTKEVGKGTGQGLSIAYRIIFDQHKGKLQVRSKPGTGTVFSITLPRKVAYEEAVAVTA